MLRFMLMLQPAGYVPSLSDSATRVTGVEFGRFAVLPCLILAAGSVAARESVRNADIGVVLGRRVQHLGRRAGRWFHGSPPGWQDPLALKKTAAQHPIIALRAGLWLLGVKEHLSWLSPTRPPKSGFCNRCGVL